MDQKLTLGEGQLVLTRNVTDYEIDISVSHWTVAETKHTHPVTSGGTATATSHRHQYKGKKENHGSQCFAERLMLLSLSGNRAGKNIL